MKRGVGIICLIILGGLVFLWVIKGNLIAAYLSHKMKVPVSIGWIVVRPSYSTIKGFKIRNPKGYYRNNALTAEQIDVRYQLKDLFGNPTVVDEIHADEIVLNIEFDNPMGTKNNWTKLMANLSETSDKDGKEVLIRHLLLTNILVQIRGFKLAGIPKEQKIARLEFNNVSSKKGFPTQELIQKIFGGAGLQQYLQEILKPAEGLIREFLPFIKGENEVFRPRIEKGPQVDPEGLEISDSEEEAS